MIAAGAEHTAAVTEDGDLYGWGWGRYGNLGLGDHDDRFVPEKVSPVEVGLLKERMFSFRVQGIELLPVLQIHFVCLSLLCLSKLFSFYFQGEKMVLVACGWRHSITVSSSGGLYMYGWSKYGQLGHGDFEDHQVPRKLEALKDCSISQVLIQNTNLL